MNQRVDHEGDATSKNGYYVSLNTRPQGPGILSTVMIRSTWP